MASADELSDAEELFYGEEIQEIVPQDVLENVIDELDVSEKKQTFKRGAWISTYIRIFEDMVELAHKVEYRLLSEAEWDVFTAYTTLPYNTRFLIVRLALRKAGQWYPLAKLESFKKEVGDGLPDAIDLACKRIYPPPYLEDLAQEPNSDSDIIDLTLDSDDDPPVLEPSVERSHVLFCQNEADMSLDELLNCLNVDQLKSLARDLKVAVSKQTKPNIIASLRRHAANQSTLTFAPTPTKGARKGKPRGDGKPQQTLDSFFGSQPAKSQGKRQTQLGFPKQEPDASHVSGQESILRKLALRRLVKCVRLRPEIYDLFLRVHIITFRSTEMPASLALPALLTAFKKRSYSKYAYERSDKIWSSREEFLKYVDALILDAKVESLVETGFELGYRRSAAPKAKPSPSTLATPLRTPLAGSKYNANKLESPSGSLSDDGEPLKTPREQQAEEARDLFETEIFPVWNVLLSVKQQKGELEPRKAGLERFEPGFVYTKMVSKSLRCLATLKYYRRELEVVEALLAQKSWLKGKCARWYERRAILLTRYLSTGEDGKKDRNVLARARQGVADALQDEDTSLVFRPSLFRRLVALEKRLNVPESERSQCEGELRKPETCYVEAVRRWDRPEGLDLDTSGRPKTSTDATSDDKENDRSVTPAAMDMPPATPIPPNRRTTGLTPGPTKTPTVGTTASRDWKWKGKSLWQGTEGNDNVVNVEMRALQEYQAHGFKGFHSETSILTTLFGLLFWDIIFANIPGAFETPYQTAPLDLGDEIFYYARKDLIEVRLKEIRNGWAKSIVEKHDTAHREKATWCVGVRWDFCERDDLLEITECLGGETLAVICRLFCESYNERSSGVPDLVVWNAEDKICKFVEVKGPGDTERENQKLWMNCLLNAGTEVEVCRVHEPGKKPVTKSGKTPRSAKQSKAAAGKGKGKTKGKASSTAPVPARSRPGKEKATPSARHNPLPLDSDDDEIQIIDGEEWMHGGVDATPCPSSSRKRHSLSTDDIFNFPSTPIPPTKRTRTA
ncbi:hypothetical protein HGRIS_012753 [Hohenbuehelia grisea]|uniref:Fanconi-associated nuclease n=1 Tax=Hohenbuehelia grisea TaxID=104357 RepID=A0ABR3ITF7_9AGAR